MSVHNPVSVYDALSGQAGSADPHAGVLVVVNPAESAPTGWGPGNVQNFQSSHTNALPTNESAEQGWGVGPERRWAHYPHAEQGNPYRRMNAMQRDGEDAYSADVYRPEVVVYWSQALAYEASQAPVKVRQASVAGPIYQPPSVPFVTTVPPANAGLNRINPGGY